MGGGILALSIQVIIDWSKNNSKLYQYNKELCLDLKENMAFHFLGKDCWELVGCAIALLIKPAYQQQEEVLKEKLVGCY
jgi:hypothetical protein